MTGNITLIARTVPSTREATAPSRPVTREDSATLAQLLREAYGSAATGSQEQAETMVQDALEGAFGPFLAEQSRLVEDENGNPVAAAMVLERRTDSHLPDAPYLFELFTASSHRRRGLAEQLVRSVMASLHENGYEEVCVRIPEDNAAALALYLTLDFNRWTPEHDEL
ncbi:GNAT family N-acetyltransferase [Kocuria sp.]|uniref:GNAT family N-acetyltransferase n=1 Tax=Kocuria sp. TaxID=1871328 RepID=UPI0026DAFA69|nr:GNAT family N-acetyltransferase [Kocuria sp.]MDO4919763.1 GNAT family N-acetyltransferase [Kocuria sp.]